MITKTEAEVIDSDRIDLCVCAVRLIEGLKEVTEGLQPQTDLEEAAYCSALKLLKREFDRGPRGIEVIPKIEEKTCSAEDATPDSGHTAPVKDASGTTSKIE